MVEAEVTLLTTEEGGRRTGVDLDRSIPVYMPHIVVGDPLQRAAIVDAQRRVVEEYLGVRFLPAKQTLTLGARATVELELMFHPHPGYDRLQPGVTFTIREGARIVGYGTILTRRDSQST